MAGVLFVRNHLLGEAVGVFLEFFRLWFRLDDRRAFGCCQCHATHPGGVVGAGCPDEAAGASDLGAGVSLAPWSSATCVS